MTSKQERVEKDLGDGLVLRSGDRRDADALARFNADIHREGEDKPNPYIAAWVRDLAEGGHPTTSSDDFTIVEDRAKKQIVSSCVLISQTWEYEGIAFGVGRPELVGTHPDYRRRGLVRAQFELMHKWSEARGELVQAITGIPWYYRQFGYEMAVDLVGGRLGYRPLVPELEKGKKEPFRIRKAEEADINLIARLYEQGSRRYRLRTRRTEEIFEYELSGRRKRSDMQVLLRVIEDDERQAVGVFSHSSRLFGPAVVVTFFELANVVSWAEVTPSVIRYMRKMGKQYQRKADREWDVFAFWLGRDHPVFAVIEDRLPRTRDPYAWYIRVPDLIKFLQVISPALEKKLVGSPVEKFSGDIKLSFYRSGIKITFESGLIMSIEEWQPEIEEPVCFPDLTFLQLLFGYRNLAELEHAFADCSVDDDTARALLTAMFPKQASHIWPLA
jgi:hypothetical protein